MIPFSQKSGLFGRTFTSVELQEKEYNRPPVLSQGENRSHRPPAVAQVSAVKMANALRVSAVKTGYLGHERDVPCRAVAADSAPPTVNLRVSVRMHGWHGQGPACPWPHSSRTGKQICPCHPIRKNGLGRACARRMHPGWGHSLLFTGSFLTLLPWPQISPRRQPGSSLRC